MHLPERLRYYGAPVLGSIVIFFHFFGHLCLNFVDLLTGKQTLSWHGLLYTVYRSGVNLLIPLLLISSLLGISIVLNIYNILSPFDLQHEVLLVSQKMLFYDLLPFLIGLMLSVQTALNLITARIKKLNLTPDQVITLYIIPIIFGISFSALILYLYSISFVFISIYFCFKFLLYTDIYDYMFHLTSTITSSSIIYSIFKMMLYCTIVSLIVGYYYYQVATRHSLLRKAMSRIITRSFIWLIIGSVYFKLIAY
ncbi:ABC transporter permease [Legionella nautarum]|uniref:ABC transporter permease n=1 Tax=Legionella nautarum TaxID=45070 RepID=A0A0W0WTX1_9GAMM|nr:ABC transporter permease [Legionella nautarum]KTD35779.1 ABC transporter permease [Legionella nautarum]